MQLQARTMHPIVAGRPTDASRTVARDPSLVCPSDLREFAAKIIFNHFRFLFNQLRKHYALLARLARRSH
jgi:hypothetical protein